MQQKPPFLQLKSIDLLPVVVTLLPLLSFRSTQDPRLRLLSGRRSEICGVPVQKRWCQRWKVLHHLQKAVASLEPEGNKDISTRTAA